MKLDWKTAASVARALAAAGLVVVAGRLAFVAGAAAMEKPDARPPTPAPAPVSSSRRGPDRVAASSAPSADAPAPFGTPIRVKLIVLSGPDRSDVYVDQANLGKTPFIGDMSCRSGETVHIRLTPPQGKDIELERPCVAGTIRVEGP